MKKLLISIMTISLVGIAAFGASRAFFSDTETSQGNTFQAGKINLEVDSQCSYNGAPSTECGTWTARDLNPTSDKFFNFTDIKPGDYGENTISLHPTDNDAYACLIIGNMLDDSTDNYFSKHLEFFTWDDKNENNIWESGEIPLFANIKGPAFDVLNGKSYTLADKSLGSIAGGSTKYIGVYWCAGSITVDPAGNTLSCDGSAMGNDAQGKAISADIQFYIEQERNNDNFSCANRTLN